MRALFDKSVLAVAKTRLLLPTLPDAVFSYRLQRSIVFPRPN